MCVCVVYTVCAGCVLIGVDQYNCVYMTVYNQRTLCVYVMCTGCVYMTVYNQCTLCVCDVYTVCVFDTQVVC